MSKEIRRITNDDWDDCLRLALLFFNEAAQPLGYEFEEERFRKLFNIALDDTVFKARLAVVDDKVIGIAVVAFIDAMLSKQTVCQEMMWYLEKPYRGNSIGYKLFKQMEEFSKPYDFFIMIDVEKTDTNTARFYEKSGFEMQEKYYVRKNKREET